MPLTLPRGAFAKHDASDDALFYQPARMVTHVDGPALAALTDHDRARLAPGADVLDPMSSWIGHLPGAAACDPALVNRG